MEQLLGLDAVFVHQESRRSPMHVTAVLIYDIGAGNAGAISCAELRETCAQQGAKICPAGAGRYGFNLGPENIGL